MRAIPISLCPPNNDKLGQMQARQPTSRLVSRQGRPQRWVQGERPCLLHTTSSGLCQNGPTKHFGAWQAGAGAQINNLTASPETLLARTAAKLKQLPQQSPWSEWQWQAHMWCNELALVEYAGTPLSPIGTIAELQQRAVAEPHRRVTSLPAAGGPGGESSRGHSRAPGAASSGRATHQTDCALPAGRAPERGPVDQAEARAELPGATCASRLTIQLMPR